MMGAIMKKLILILAMLVGACAGPVGPEGPQGTMGAMGIPGENAADGSKIVANIACGGTLSATQLTAFYSVSQFANGNVFATASLLSDSGEGTGSVVFSPGQDGYLNAPVIFAYDVYGTPTGGYWTLTLNRNPMWAQIVYSDDEVPGGDLLWAWQADACHVQSF
jgi:hypothetical protein